MRQVSGTGSAAARVDMRVHVAASVADELQEWARAADPPGSRRDVASLIFVCWAADEAELDLRGSAVDCLPHCLRQLSSLRTLHLDRGQARRVLPLALLPPRCKVVVHADGGLHMSS